MMIVRIAAAGLLAAVACAGAGCGSSPVAAPVADRSVNATPPPAARPQAAKPPTPAPVAAAATARPAEPAKAADPASTKSNEAAPVKSAEPAPVVKAGPAPEPIVVQAIEDPPAKPYRDGDWRPEFHVVKKGETLYSIALDYGQEYRELAAWNRLEDPGVIKVDQRLRLFPRKATRRPLSLRKACRLLPRYRSRASPRAARCRTRSRPWRN